MSTEAASGAWRLAKHILMILVKRQPTCSFRATNVVMRITAILSGYRLVNQPWSYYLLSLFQIHNETFNVWSHLIGCCVVLQQIYSYAQVYTQAGSDIIGTLYTFGSCCFVTLLSSAVAHLFHSKSPFTNFIVFMFDYIGVVFWLFGTGLLALYGVSDAESYKYVKSAFLIIHLCMCYLNFINICYGKLWFRHDLSDHRRKLMMIIGIGTSELIVLIPFAARYVHCFYDNHCTFSSLSHITIVMMLFCVLATVFFSHQPEKMFPGTFDLIGQSHHIFHVLVVVIQCLQFRALYIDYQHGHNAHCVPNVKELMTYIVVLYTACACTILYLRGEIRAAIRHDTWCHRS